MPLIPSFFIPTVDDKDPPTQPIDLGQPHLDIAKTILTLPEGWGAELPKEVHQKTPYISFDKTYKIDHQTLTVERKIEVLQRRIPVAEWKTYKKWQDATVTDGEPWIQLISNGATNKAATSEKVPPLAGQNNPEAADLAKEASEEVQRGEANKAADTLDRAKKINDKQPGLWILYGLLRTMQGRYGDAIEAFQREVAINPSNYLALAGLADAQLKAGQTVQASESMRAFNRNSGP